MLTIGLLINVPPAAVPSTERQFQSLLAAAAGDLPLRLRWFRLSGAKPSHYEAIETLWADRLDGLIVTGTEPKAQALPDEPLWPALTRTIGWAAENTRSTIFSCLAAHAAVWYLDAVDRVPGADKIFGLFTSVKVAEHPLVAGLPAAWTVPHSRWNDLAEADLLAAGYAILAKSGDAGVDLFIKTVARSLFVFIQTHPEYGIDSLMREYARDLTRFHTGQQDYCPRVPRNYFGTYTEARLDALRAEMIAMRGKLPAPLAAPVADTWSTVAVQLYGNWLQHLAVQSLSVLA